MYAFQTRHYLILEFTLCPEIHHIWSIKKIKLTKVFGTTKQLWHSWLDNNCTERVNIVREEIMPKQHTNCSNYYISSAALSAKENF